jgi:hypothetical protein
LIPFRNRSREILLVLEKALTYGVAQTFGFFLRGLIDKRFVSLREFIRKAQPLAIESSAVGYLSKVIAGSKPPPMDRIDAWADALGLEGDLRQEFMNLALEDLLARAPSELRKWVISLRAEVVQLREQNSTVCGQLEQLVGEKHKVAPPTNTKPH